MPTHFRYDCPHCLTRNAGFVVRYQWHDRQLTSFSNHLSVCGVCNEGLLVKSVDKGSSTHYGLIQQDLDFPGNRFEIIESWPKYHSESPESVPPNVASFYEQGLENLQNKRWDAAGAMFRKCLDVATKILAPEHRSEKLYPRINKMVEEGALTNAMGDWSHEIRLDGNDAVHDEEPESEEDARATHKFTEAFLTYAFTLPALVSHRSTRAGE